MVNKIKRFFKGIGKGGGQSPPPPPFSAFPMLADNQMTHERGGGTSAMPLMPFTSPSESAMPVLMLPSTAAEASGSGSGADEVGLRIDAIRWGLLLPRIPRLVAEATAAGVGAGPANSPHSSRAAAAAAASSAGDDNAEMAALLEMLTQMAPKEIQAQILGFYMGEGSTTASSGNVWGLGGMNASWEQRKVFRQCRRSLLLCWKYIVAQLNDESARVTSELRETYFQLVGLIAERVEFNLSADTSSSSSSGARNGPSRRDNNSGHGGMGWIAGSPTAAPAAAPTSSLDASGSSSSEASSDDSVDGERDLYLYRCLLVATFKYVVENVEGAKARRRSWITIAELQFYAKMSAICFFRVPVLQRMVIDQVYFTYRQKKWTNNATAGGSEDASTSSPNNARPTPDSRSNNRRRSSSRLSSGVTFSGSLARWSEFEGHTLSEPTNDGEDPARDDASANDSNQSAASPSNSYAQPSRAAVDKFKRTNPTLFRWSRYTPYLAPYTDTDVFRMNDAMRLSWLEKLSHDGEFFALFMGYYAQHADLCAVGEPVWNCLPGYPLLVRVSLLVLKEASWSKWLYIRDNTAHSTPSILLNSPSPAADDERAPFELKSIRGVRALMATVPQWLRNRELLESCTLAVFECTNVLNARSVGFCLAKFEEWFSVAAVLVAGETEQLVYRLPRAFAGQTFAIGIRLMLSSDSFETLNLALQFLYNRMDYFDGELRQNILKVLVQRHMSLFLHWNADVRSNYHHLLVYKITRVNRFFLDSPIDHLLLGRHAVMHLESAGGVSDGYHDFDDHLSGGAATASYGNLGGGDSHDNSGGQFQITAAEFSALRTEQALWRAFDACIGAICVQERRNAKEGNRRYQYEIQCARSRAVAFQRLNRKVADDPTPSSSVNEGLPGGKPWLELDLLDEELHREPPYYLRYLPAEEVSSIDELRRLASTLRYPQELQVYASSSLRHYSDLLKKYYRELRKNKFVEAPPLGFM
ncbi:hypothetical protein PybrP1_002421 [[Pythium] brassicae (nom. inval.)]|nr:hypothetical protein PybrP1_002421 [[Pythium] brassicae (nom. inval.)]